MAFALDALPAITAAYSLRRLLTSYAGNACQVRRASDNATLDIGFIGEDLDTATLSTFLAATAGFITTKYDHGSGFDLTMATAANQPGIVIAEATMANRPAISYVGANSTRLARSGTPTVAQPASMFLVAEKTGNLAASHHVFNGSAGSSLVFFPAPGGVAGGNFGATQSGPAADNVAHCIGVVTGATGPLAIDGVITNPGSFGAGSGTGMRFGSNTGGVGSFFTGFAVEGIVSPSLWSNADIGTLQANQRAYWIEPPPPSTGTTGGQPKQRGTTVLRHDPQPLSKRAAKRLRKGLGEALPHRSARELEALYARLVGDKLPPEEIEPVAAIVRPFAAASDAAPEALPPTPAVDFRAIARTREASAALVAAIGGLLEVVAARQAEADEQDDEEAVAMMLLAVD
jgi:hypothetical protein